MNSAKKWLERVKKPKSALTKKQQGLLQLLVWIDIFSREHKYFRKIF